ncbi:MAG: acetyl-CoA carboxylase carboxyltransferase subunit alpha [Endomicrobiales bacterium]|nr:acetyl-CoA carboxylase carboxyltransferase subunit alpha [Endomicrobiales bacterium]
MAEEMSYLEFERPVMELERKIAGLKSSDHGGRLDLSGEIRILEGKCSKLKNEIYGSLSTWQKVQLARHPLRPYTLDYFRLILTDFTELHGDRSFRDDRALVCGLAMLANHPVAVVGQQKGRNLQENMERNFGMAHPEGYRKAMRVMKLAEKFGLPVISFIDTPGAYPGIGAEERGQAEAIARNLRDMSDLRVPIIAVVIGEGGSGGALGIGVANRVLMLENAYYSVITPEGCAAILFRDASKAADAANALKITATDLLEFGVIDEIIDEPLGGAHKDAAFTAENIKKSLLARIAEFKNLTPDEVAMDRYRRFRDLGTIEEGSPELKVRGSESKSKKIKRKKK